MHGFTSQKEQINKFWKDYIAGIHQMAAAMLETSLPNPAEELFALFETTGNRLQYEQVYFERRKFLTVYGLEAYIEKDNGCISKEILKKLEEVLCEICAEECWALPAHVDRKGDADWRVTVDLFAAETAQAVAEIADTLRAELPEEIYRMVYENVEKRVFNPFFTSSVPYRNWEHCRHNWNAVCAGAIGCAGIHMMKHTPDRLAACLHRVCDALSNFVSGYAEDGACMEGLSYFTYGMSYFSGFADEMEEYSGGRIDLLAQEKCAKMALFQQKCYIGKNRTISFSDGDSRDRFRMGLTCYLAMRFNEVTIPDIAGVSRFEEDACFRFLPAVRDYRWTKRYLERERKAEQPTERQIGQCVLSSAQWSICRAQNGIDMACKGGSNDEPHNHNDIGSFMYVAGEEVFLDDLGAGEYTKDYFGERRYDILCNSSLGHSVPVINGRGQMHGKEYACSRFEADEKGKTMIQFAQAYEEDSLAEVCRILDFDTVDGRLKITDTFACAPGCEVKELYVSERLITRYIPVINGNHIIIKGNTQSCSIVVENLNGMISCLAYSHSNHQGIKEIVYAVIWEVSICQGNGQSVFIVNI